MAEIRVIKSSDLARCPKHSLLPAHYRPNGTCLCDQREEAEVAVAEAEAEVRSAKRHLEAVRRWRDRT